MRIAQVAPLAEPIPARYYGSTERVVAYLTDELVARGDEVTLFASEGSRTTARLAAGPPAPRRGGHDAVAAPYFAMLSRLLDELDSYDVVHFHLDFLHFPFIAGRRFQHLTTEHGWLDTPQLAAVHGADPDLPRASVSLSQRASLRQLDWIGNVPYGLPEHLYTRGEGGDDLVFLGRVGPSARIDRAISVAIGSKHRLRVAGRAERRAACASARMRERLRHPLIECLGDVDDASKQQLLGNAAALIFPVDAPPPFALVAVEALACGTPVIAWDDGAMPEIIEHGVTGFIVDSIDAGIAAVNALPSISRDRCRQAFEQHFTAAHMASSYRAIYERLLGCKRMRVAG